MFYFVTLTFLIFCFILVPHIPQNQDYHKFAGDGLKIHNCCPNTNNVISNIPFALVGVYGLLVGPRTLGWVGFSLSSIGVCLGSGYYHWTPNNLTLVWDRLPMTLCTMSAAFEIFKDYGFELTLWDFYLWWIVGLYSVFYWKQVDDLRLYAFVQYAPILAMLNFMIMGYKLESLNQYGLLFAIAIYALARVMEYFDYYFYFHTPLSGHVWKHLLCSYSMFLLIEEGRQALIRRDDY